MSGHVVAVHRSPDHSFSKATTSEIELIAGLGVVGDAHMGAQVKHRSRVAADPTQPNLRQVHLIGEELFDHVAARGFDIAAGELGENITTAGVDLLAPGGAGAALTEACRGDENVVPYILDCARAYCTLYEIRAAMEEVFGSYKEPVFF